VRNQIKKMFTNQDGWIALYGDAYWAAICDTMPCGQWFSIADAIKPFTSRTDGIVPLSERTARQYVSAVLRNVMAEGNGVVKSRGNTLGRMYMI
jgi:hypothetical protein